MPHMSLRALIAAAVAALATSAAQAEERGVGPYLVGTVATLADHAPAEPGFTSVFNGFHFKGEIEEGTLFPVAGVLTSGINAEGTFVTLGGLHTFEQRIFGAFYTVGAFASVIDAKAEARVVTPFGLQRRTDTVSGLGDITLLPAALAWRLGRFQVTAALPIETPSGDFEAGRIINAGSGVWTVDPLVGLAYFDETTGFGASGFAGVTLSSENPYTDYQNGALLHMEASVEQLFPVGPGLLGVGVNGFWLHQLTADSGPGAILGDFRSSSLGIGPTLSYRLPQEEGIDATLEFRWLPEIKTRNRIEGDYFWLKGILNF